ncbi:hypothetical protein EVA_10093 [gut metagenome]|uniref:Uncharacterized protein n=1 Tax=gut metagenome TaxID=749906 RepID=J9G4K8_9ZZZZ
MKCWYRASRSVLLLIRLLTWVRSRCLWVRSLRRGTWIRCCWRRLSWTARR